MADSSTSEQFLDIIRESFSKELLLKITLGKPKKKGTDLKNVFIRPVVIGEKKLLTFIYRHLNRDITKNYSSDEGLAIISKLLSEQFLQANLFDKTRDVQLMISSKGKVSMKIMKPSSPMLQTLSHDKIKKRLIKPEGKIYLQELGITNKDFAVIPSMNSKFKQINKFIEIIDSILPEKITSKDFSVVDMGSGKGYLTFALYDHLSSSREIPATVTGIEMRKDLVEKCNSFAKNADFDKLTFVESNIQEYSLEKVNMLIALHACDTATDDAIFKGIAANADYIVVAPCCHKQVRKAMHPENEMKPVLKHGIYLERQAELLTDGIRGLILEKHGYKIKALEFISTEHTPKNVMIIATKTDKNIDKDKINAQIEELKKSFGIEYHHLETLLSTY